MSITKIFIKVRKVVKNQINVENLKFTNLKKSAFKIRTALNNKINFYFRISIAYTFTFVNFRKDKYFKVHLYSLNYYIS